jgi:hypothetical protein
MSGPKAILDSVLDKNYRTPGRNQTLFISLHPRSLLSHYGLYRMYQQLNINVLKYIKISKHSYYCMTKITLMNGLIV